MIDTAGNVIPNPISCNCNRTGGCDNCWGAKKELELKKWKKRFNASFEKKHKKLFPKE